jgi:4-aminobutyrate aminotransferase/(S)-3-amino-2-methylpropionate transaminase
MGKYFAKVTTEIPGKYSTLLKNLGEKFVASGSMYSMYPIIAAKSEGAIITDVDGNEYIDFYAGVGVANLGNRNTKVIDAVRKQLDKVVHTCFGAVMNEPFIRLAEKLAEITPGNFEKKTALFNSGSEAVDNAIKIARAHTKRRATIAFDGAFHGKTLLATTLNGIVKPLKQGYGPYISEVYRFPYPYCYRCPFGMKYPECSLRCLKFIEEGFLTRVDAVDVAALILEPMLGDGGYVFAPNDFLTGLQKLCKKYGIVFIVDEIQTGFGRTGKLFASEHSGIEPDMILMSKSISDGFPVSAITGRKEIMDSAPILGGTFVGHPVSCAAALAVLDIFKKENILDEVKKKEKIIRDRLEEMYQNISLIGNIDGKGMAWRIELVKDRTTKEPAPELTIKACQECLKKGLIIMKSGVYRNVIRFIAPLTIEDDQLNEGFDILENVLKAISGNI